MLISIIAPCYNEALNLVKFKEAVLEQFDKIKKYESSVLGGVDVEIEFVLVDDGSKDNTEEVLLELAEQDERVKPLFFSRNFGKEAAVLAGLTNAKGDAVILLDADLQHPVELIPKMWEKFKNGADVAFARRVNREGESKIRAFFSNMFYKFNKFISGVKLMSGTSDYRLMSREVINSILSINEYHRFSKNIFEWIGFKKEMVEYEYKAREAGASSWSFTSLFKYAVEGILSFSAAPLRLAFLLGFGAAFFGGFYGFYLMIKWIIFGNQVSGWTSLSCLMSFFGGLILIVQGIQGEYIARIYEQSKNRPHYIIKKQKKRKG